MTRRLIAVVFPMVLLATCQPRVLAQRQNPAPGPSRGGAPGGPMAMGPDIVALQVMVRESTGAPMDIGVIVQIDSYAGSVHMTSATRDAGTATFTNIPPGDYTIQASAPGYESASERVSVMGGMSNYPAYIYMQPQSAPSMPKASGTPAIMTPRLQAEIDKALDKIRHEQYDAARTHFEKAEKMAPGNPDVQYLFGLLEYKQEHFDAARKRFETAISLYPGYAKPYLVLGELLLRTGHGAEAVQNLEKAYQINGADWRVHLLLAEAYFAEKQYDKVERHASRAVELDKNNSAAAQVVLGEVLAAEGKREQAIQSFQRVLLAFPKDPSAPGAKARLEELQRPVLIPAAEKATSPEKTTSPASTPPEPVPVAKPPEATAPVAPVATAAERVWAPPDIDAKEYPLAAGVACHKDTVLHLAEIRGKRQLTNFERFTATEHIVHQEIDAQGKPEIPKEKDFGYLVFIQKGHDGSFYLDEERDGGENLNEFPTRLASTGLVSLGIAVFREDFQRQLSYTCEGLAKWRGEPAWQIRFEQRRDAPAHLRTWRNVHGTYAVPLKGRVWVSANTYDVLHLETDLREPQREIGLTRDHLVVDYGPVKFEHGNTSLWLPWYADMYMELHGKRYHHRHTLTNYELFSVDTRDAVEVPDPNGHIN